MRVVWDSSVDALYSRLSYGGRGLELSELVVYDGRLLAVDDRTGVVYSVDAATNTIVPWVVLTDGDGNSEKGASPSLLYLLHKSPRVVQARARSAPRSRRSSLCTRPLKGLLVGTFSAK